MDAKFEVDPTRTKLSGVLSFFLSLFIPTHDEGLSIYFFHFKRGTEVRGIDVKPK